jgi:D-alanyl-lipoteichoic acid acyltransferase DltB (MBOAT superfamily)
MVFTSLHFAAFFVVVYALYRVLPHRAQNVMLLVASYYFYAAWDWRFLSLLIGSTVVDFLVGLYLGADRPPERRKLALIISLVYNLGVLAIFKYFNFFEESLISLAGWFGWHLDGVTLNVILPIGISFYTFMTVSYVIDVYRREIKPTSHLLDFALFVAYFPHLVAGPILRASLLLPQIEKPRTISKEQSVEGFWLIGWGCFQKMFLADNLAPLVETVFTTGASPGGLDVVLAVYAFALQIYGDFAGYSNIARGVSKLLGIELNINFLFPFFSTSIQAYWRAWHISLSTWLRDYLYIPLGGSRGGELKTYRNLLITMTLGGLWHGAAWTTVLWGTYQGVCLVVGRMVGVKHPDSGESLSSLSLRRLLPAFAMFQVWCLGLLLFRSTSLAHFAQLSQEIVTNFGPTPLTWSSLALPFLQITAPFLVVHVYQARRGSELAPMALPLVVRYALYAALFWLVLLFGSFQGAQFIYFQF